MNAAGYSPRFVVLWRGKQSRRYHMHAALRLMRRMRRLGAVPTLTAAESFDGRPLA